MHGRFTCKPFGPINLMAVGGVSLENAEAFIRCGACALGIRSDLVNPAIVAARDFTAIARTASQFIEIVQRAKRAD